MLQYPEAKLDTRIEFVGREAELAQLRSLIERGGAVTLVGPGGVGKSRVAHEAAIRAQRDLALNVVSIGLSGSSGEDVFGAVALALGVREELGRHPERVLRLALKNTRTLLLIDNCEHIPDESGALMELLASIEGVSAVATSQRRLDYAGERIVEIAPFDALTGALFFAARARLAGVVVSENDAEDVRAIVSRLDGLAIAIDLAAARLVTLPVPELARELKALRPYSFRSTAKVERRHWTIGRVVEWTCSLLDESACNAFVVAASFVDAFAVDDLAVVLGVDLTVAQAAIRDLCTYSLLFENDGYFAMLAPIRAVAVRMLSSRQDRRVFEERFALRMTAVAGAEREAPIARLALRYSDYTAALGWALKRPAERLTRVLDLTPVLVRVWADGGRFDDGMRWVERLLEAAPSLPAAVRADTFYLAIRVWHAASHFEKMLAIGPTAISSYQISGNTLGLARAYNALSIASLYTNKIDDAQKYVETAVAIYRQLKFKRGLGTALTNLANVLLEGRRDPHAAYGRYEEALALLQEDGNDHLVGITLGNMAESAHFMGEYDRSLQLCSQASACFARTQSAPLLAWMRQCAARTHLAQGNVDAARAELLAACDLLSRAPQPLYIALTAETAASLLAQTGERMRALVLFAATAKLRRERKLPATGPDGERTAERRAALDAVTTGQERTWAEAEAAAIDAAHLPAKAQAFLALAADGGASAPRAESRTA